MLCQFPLYSKMNQLYIYTYPLFFGFPSHLGHHSALSRVPWAIQYVLISYLFYTWYKQCICVNPNLPNVKCFRHLNFGKCCTIFKCLSRRVTMCHIKKKFRDCPGGVVVESPPANAGDTGSVPGPGRSHMPRSSWARVPQLLSLRSRAREPRLLSPLAWSPCSVMGEATTLRGPRTAAKTPQLEGDRVQQRGSNAVKNKLIN